MPSDDNRSGQSRSGENGPGSNSGSQERANFQRREVAEELDAFLSGGAADAAESEEQSSGGGKSSRKPPGGTVRFNANLPTALHRQLKSRSAEEGRSMTDIAIEAISTYLSDK